MKSLFILALLCGASVAPAQSKVQIVQETRRPMLFGMSQGSGHANLMDVSGVYGFDFVYSGCHAFQTSIGGSRYRARLDGPHDLMLMTSPIGTDLVESCHLKITMKDFRYAVVAGRLTTAPAINKSLAMGQATSDEGK